MRTDLVLQFGQVKGVFLIVIRQFGYFLKELEALWIEVLDVVLVIMWDHCLVRMLQNCLVFLFSLVTDGVCFEKLIVENSNEPYPESLDSNYNQKYVV